MNQRILISEEETDKLQEEGVAILFDCKCNCENKSENNCKNCDGYHGFGGFFEARPGARKDIILVITNEGHFIRAAEDLVKSQDEVFVGFIEDGEIEINFEDVFKVEKL